MSHPQSSLGGPPHQTGDLFPDHFRRAMIPVVLILVLAAVAWFTKRDKGSEDPAQAGSSVSAQVDRVVDGDTAQFRIDGESESVRYIGIDTPEMNYDEGRPSCFAEEATDRNRELLARNDEVDLVFDREKRDHYGRLLAYVYSSGTLLQSELLRGGYATTIEIPPNTSKAEQFRTLEEDARSANRGGWNECGDSFGR